MRELTKVRSSAGTTFTTWACGVCFGVGHVPRELAEGLWRDRAIPNRA